MRPDELYEIKHGAHLQSIMPELEAEVEGMKQTTMVHAFTLIRQNKLTPEEAYNILMELYSYDRLVKRFETKIKVATTTAEKHQNTLNIGDDNGKA